MPRRLRAYLRFLVDHRRLLAFGLLAATVSGFGQTFYIGLFNNEIRDAFGLTYGELGLVYGGATLAGATLLVLIGRIYDRIDLRAFLVAGAATLAGGCALLGGTEAIAGLAAALFLLRLGGQGMMGHVALTTMARRFHHGRGKAVSVAAMGYPLAEAAFPALAVALLTVVTWRGAWLVAALLVVTLFLPLLLILLRGAGKGEAPPDEHHPAARVDWTLREVLRDRRLAAVVAAAVSAPFVVTVVFFHQVPLAESKGWSRELVASGLGVFALGHILGLLVAGPIVDRWTGRRVLPPALLPLVASMLVLGSFDAQWAALAWPALLGTTLGLAGTSGNALLAELYGVAHLGAIRSLLQALVIVATAVGPPVAGILLDRGFGAAPIAIGLAIAITAIGLAARLALSPAIAPASGSRPAE